ncbi:MAG: hypothetical protein ACRCX2_22190 [Paraclostridium sp.]
MKGYIYCFTFNNGKTYVGQTVKSVKDREYQHLYYAKKDLGSAFQSALRKYGNEYTLEVLKEVTADTRELLDIKLNKYEVFYIKQLDSLCHQNGYNIETGGSRGKRRVVVHELDWYKEHYATKESFKEACEYHNVEYKDYTVNSKRGNTYTFITKEEKELNRELSFSKKKGISQLLNLF